MNGDEPPVDDRDADEMAQHYADVVQLDSKRKKGPPLNLVGELVKRMRPGNAAEFEAAMRPAPHVFMGREAGFLPFNEAAIYAGAAREGKTLTLVSIAAALRLGISVGGLSPHEKGLATLIVTAEDSREQYLRKISAVAHAIERTNGKSAADHVRAGIVVLDLEDEPLAHVRSLVTVEDRQPKVGPIADALTFAVRATQMRYGLTFGLTVFETASTLNDADESNPALRAMVLAVRRVARRCSMAGVLSHHLSQAALTNLRDLNLSVADIRGATALVNNARQCCVLVNLGDDADPFPENDKRTMLRRMVDEGCPESERGESLAVLVTLDSSKADKPPPIYFRRVRTECGPALLPIPTPDGLDSLSWRRQVERVRGMAADVRGTTQEAAQMVAVQQVVDAVAKIDGSGKQATAKAVSTELGHGAEWATPRLDRAVREGRLRCEQQGVKHCKGTVPVYLPLNRSANRSAPEHKTEA